MVRNAILAWFHRRWNHRSLYFTAALMAVGLGALGVRAGAISISQAGQVFSMKGLTLAAGDTAVFLNDDDVRHNIRVIDSDDNMTDIGVQEPGQHLTYRFDKVGKFRVRCGIHPSMKLTVTVK